MAPSCIREPCATVYRGFARMPPPSSIRPKPMPIEAERARAKAKAKVRAGAMTGVMEISDNEEEQTMGAMTTPGRAARWAEDDM